MDTDVIVKEFEKEEPTQPVPVETMAEISAQWQHEIAISERPTVDIRKRPRVRAKSEP